MNPNGGRGILVYAQDVGGTKCLLPLLAPFRSEIRIVAHPLAESPLRDAGFDFSRAGDVFRGLPAQPEAVGGFLDGARPDLLIATLSSNRLDLTNAFVIREARSRGIRSVGFLDHWKGYDRFFDSSGAPAYMTDVVGCIDDHCRARLLEIDPDPRRFPVIGHPHLEEFLRAGRERRRAAESGVVLISQPDSKRDFEGIFRRGSEGSPVVEILAEEVAKAGLGSLRYRAHPKERLESGALGGIALDDSGDWRRCLDRYPVFIGLDSMLLVEAALGGRSTISLALPVFEEYLGEMLPYRLGKRIASREEIGPTLRQLAASSGSSSSPIPEEFTRVIEGSIARGTEVIRSLRS